MNRRTRTRTGPRDYRNPGMMRLLKKAAGGSLTKLSPVIGVTQTVISEYPRLPGRMPISKALEFEERFGVPRGMFRAELKGTGGRND